MARSRLNNGWILLALVFVAALCGFAVFHTVAVRADATIGGPATLTVSPSSGCGGYAGIVTAGAPTAWTLYVSSAGTPTLTPNIGGAAGTLQTETPNWLNPGLTFTLEDANGNILKTLTIGSTCGTAAPAPVLAPPSNASTPAALLTVNGEPNLTAKPGDVLSYQWTSANGASYRSSVTIYGPNGNEVATDPCGNTDNENWVTNSASGATQGTVVTCQVGYAYKMTYLVTAANGTTAQSAIMVAVPSATPAPMTSAPAATVNQACSILLQELSQAASSLSAEIGSIAANDPAIIPSLQAQFQSLSQLYNGDLAAIGCSSVSVGTGTGTPPVTSVPPVVNPPVSYDNVLSQLRAATSFIDAQIIAKNAGLMITAWNGDGVKGFMVSNPANGQVLATVTQWTDTFTTTTTTSTASLFIPQFLSAMALSASTLAVPNENQGGNGLASLIPIASAAGTTAMAVGNDTGQTASCAVVGTNGAANILVWPNGRIYGGGVSSYTFSTQCNNSGGCADKDSQAEITNTKTFINGLGAAQLVQNAQVSNIQLQFQQSLPPGISGIALAVSTFNGNGTVSNDCSANIGQENLINAAFVLDLDATSPDPAREGGSPQYAQSVTNTMIHEMLHCMGLGHSNNPTDIMGTVDPNLPELTQAGLHLQWAISPPSIDPAEVNILKQIAAGQTIQVEDCNTECSPGYGFKTKLQINGNKIETCVDQSALCPDSSKLWNDQTQSCETCQQLGYPAGYVTDQSSGVCALQVSGKAPLVPIDCPVPGNVWDPVAQICTTPPNDSQTQAPGITCPDGATIQNGVCTCPNGGSPINGKCEQASTNICSDDPSTGLPPCSASYPPIVCPVGYTKAPDGSGGCVAASNSSTTNTHTPDSNDCLMDPNGSDCADYCATLADPSSDPACPAANDTDICATDPSNSQCADYCTLNPDDESCGGFVGGGDNLGSGGGSGGGGGGGCDEEMLLEDGCSSKYAD